MMNPSEFLQKLRSSKHLLAPLVSIADPSVSEMMTYLSPDFLIVDMEHSVIDVPRLQDILLSVGNMNVVARIRGMEKNEVKKVLDLGVSGIIVPGIETVQDVKDLISYSKIPPEGIRGVGPGRASQYGCGFSSYLREADRQLVIIQIETRKAFDNLHEILSVPGLDGCFIGPVDLSVALGLEFSFENPDFASAVDTILKEASVNGLLTGIYTPLSNRDPSRILSREFNFIMLGTDREAIQLEYGKSMKSIRKQSTEMS